MPRNPYSFASQSPTKLQHQIEVGFPGGKMHGRILTHGTSDSSSNSALKKVKEQVAN
jgi:hypothetical protein